jgi:excisionase family DNA binding protein
MPARFLTMQDVADELATSVSQVYHMVRSGELPAIKIGGRGQWRIERSRLEEYIAQKYQETAEFVRTNPLVDHPDSAPDVEAPAPRRPATGKHR